jgi:exportin-7
LVQIFDETAQQYQNLSKSTVTALQPTSPTRTRTTSSSNIELIIKEGQLTWLVYIIGGVISGRVSYNMGNSEEHDMYDGELVVRVLQLMTFINNRLEQTSGNFCCEKLDLAMLNFFEQFRKIFIGDQVQKSSKGLLLF